MSVKDLAERIISMLTRADDERVIANPVEVKSIEIDEGGGKNGVGVNMSMNEAINLAESTSDVVDLLLSNETENERIFIHHEEAINQAENTRSKTADIFRHK